MPHSDELWGYGVAGGDVNVHRKNSPSFLIRTVTVTRVNGRTTSSSVCRPESLSDLYVRADSVDIVVVGNSPKHEITPSKPRHSNAGFPPQTGVLFELPPFM